MFDEFLHKNLKIPYKLNFETLRKVKNPRATVIFVHGLASSREMWRGEARHIDGEIDIFAVDLLGHGNSLKPKWEGVQSLENQARALKRTIFSISPNSPIFLIGHSMGSLVVAEFSALFPRISKKNFLISPPIYLPENKTSGLQEKVLRKSYKALVENPRRAIEFVNGVIDAGVVDVKKFETHDDFRPVRRALREAIIEQNTFEILSSAQNPTKIFYGALDPVVIGKNIRKLEKNNEKISAQRVLASHDPNEIILKSISRNINKILKEQKNG